MYVLPIMYLVDEEHTVTQNIHTQTHENERKNIFTISCDDIHSSVVYTIAERVATEMHKSESMHCNVINA